MKARILLIVFVLSLLLVNPGQAQGPETQTTTGTVFTYQGVLRSNNNPVSGTCDFQFSLWDAASGGTQVGATWPQAGVTVTRGLFTASLNFGAAPFQGANRWLEIAVRCPAGSGAYTTLAPRQPLTPAPYALYSAAAPWAGLLGIPAGFADNVDNDTTYTAGPGLILTGTQFSVNFAGTGAANTVARSDHDHDARYWKLNGNSGTTAGVNYLGTSDNTPLELKVNSLRALRLEPTTISPNIIAGYPGNNVISGAVGGTVSGGGTAGATNRVTDSYGTVSGGTDNQAGNGNVDLADARYATVGGGFQGTASGAYSTVAGGYGGTAGNAYAVVGGGRNNMATGESATVAGGLGNAASGSQSTIGGGWGNNANGGYATISGGKANVASSTASTVSGGQENRAESAFSAIGGGLSNLATGERSTISGGSGNQTSADAATIGGGMNNVVAGTRGTVAGGEGNMATFTYTTIGGGYQNLNQGQYATIGGGYTNTVGMGATAATIGGGQGNVISNSFSVIAGGYYNSVGHDYAAVGGGHSNVATGQYAVIGGGYSNSAGAPWSVVPGGKNNSAAGRYSFAAGYRAKANHMGTFVWADSTDADIASTAINQFIVRASGGIWLGITSTPSFPAGRFLNTSTGAYLSSGGTWTNASDRALKENFAPVDSKDILVRLSKVPILSWNYKAEDTSVRHVGPVAQDFYAAFGVGGDDMHISTVDADGVALAAIQGLYQLVQEKDAQIAAQQAQIDDLKARLAALEALVAQLAAKGGAK